MMKEIKDSIIKSNKIRLDEEKARANRESTAIESSLKQLSISIQDEVDKESKKYLQQLLEETQGQKASNEIFRKTCEEALLRTKNIYDQIEQEINNTKADNNSIAVAGLINTPGDFRHVKQNISGTSASGGSFAGSGIIYGQDLSIPSSGNK